jgi:hypothetical protein
MSDDNTQDAAEPSPASAGSDNTHMATARLSAANTWLQEEIKRLRLTDEERGAIAWFAIYADTTGEERQAKVLARLLERTK